MVGEPILQIVEQPQLVETAKRLLECDQVHVGACGLGDALKVISESQGTLPQVHWHADGGPDVKQVSFRTGLDRHDPTNAPLRVLPGSHLRAKEEVWEELLQLEIATGQHDLPPKELYAKHPAEVEVHPRSTLDIGLDTELLARHRCQDSCWSSPGDGLELLSRRRQKARFGGVEVHFC